MAREQDDTRRLLDRRSYLKMAGAATVAVTSATAASSGAASASRTIDIDDGEAIDPYLDGIDDGEHVTIPEGTYTFNGASISANNWQVDGQGCTFDVQGKSTLRLSGDEWQFGGIEFDISGYDNVQVFAEGGNWKFHNCAWSGEHRTESFDYLFYPRVRAGTTGVADQIWWGDGLGDNTDMVVKHIDGVNGEMWYRRCYFRQMGCYSTETATQNRSEGTANFDRCHAENTWHGAFRVGNDYGKTCVIKDCTIVFDDYEEAKAYTHPPRGIWAHWGDVRVENTDIHAEFGQAIATSDRTSPPAHKSGYVDVYGGNITGPVQNRVRTHDVGDNPSKQPPEGCPTSAQEAVTGTSSDDGTDTPSEPAFDHTLSIVSEGSDVVNYEFSVTEQAQKSTARGASVNSEDQIESGTVTGSIAGGTDSYDYDGQISSFSIDGTATMYLDGSQVSPDDLRQADPTDENYTGTIVIDGSNSPNQISYYELGVDGDVAKNGELGSVNSFDTASDGVIKGRVIGGKDAYDVSGGITGFHIDGRATIQYTEQSDDE